MLLCRAKCGFMQMVFVIYKLGTPILNFSFLMIFFLTIWNTCVEFGNYFIARYKQKTLLTKYGHMLVRFFPRFLKMLISLKGNKKKSANKSQFILDKPTWITYSSARLYRLANKEKKIRLSDQAKEQFRRKTSLETLTCN